MTDEAPISKHSGSYTPVSLAEKWECSPKMVYSLMATGELAAWKLGGKLFRIQQTAVDEYERRQQTAPDEGNVSSGSGSSGMDILAVAAEWNCSTAFVYSEIKSGALQAWKLGRNYRVTVEAMEAYQCQNLTASANLPVPAPTAPSIGPSPSLGMLPERGASGYPSVRQIKRRLHLSQGTSGRSTQ